MNDTDTTAAAVSEATTVVNPAKPDGDGIPAFLQRKQDDAAKIEPTTKPAEPKPADQVKPAAKTTKAVKATKAKTEPKAKARAAELEKTEAKSGKTVKLGQIVEELGIDAKIARAKLRHDGSIKKSKDGWVFDAAQAREVRAQLKG
jgi:hypothetical protein